jgi:hypothetical protein
LSVAFAIFSDHARYLEGQGVDNHGIEHAFGGSHAT